MTGIPIRGKAKGSAGAAYTIAVRRGAQRLDFLRDYFIELYKVSATLGIDADVLVAQWDLETGSGTSTYWIRDGNPAGIAAFDDGTNWGLTFTPQTAARAQITHMLRYLSAANVPADWIALDARWQAVADAGYVGTVATTADLGNGKWATDPEYASKLVERYAAYWGPYVPVETATGDKPVVTTAATHKLYTVPGGKRPLILPAWIKVQIKPVDLARVRSYEKWSKSMTTVHDSGNERTNAAAEYAWLAAGRPGGEVGGYEWINDDSGIIITGWFDETTWAQGVQDGNRRSHAGELAWGGNVVWTTALEICCAMHGAVLEMEDKLTDSAAVLHQFWTGKWCSGQILNRGIWATVFAKILSYGRQARAFRDGQPVSGTPTTTYAPRSMPMVDGKPWDGKADVTINNVKFEAQVVTAKTTAALNQRQWASTESLFVGETLPAGTSVDLLGWVAGELVDGVSEWWVARDGTRLWAGGIDAEPKVDPAYGREPEPHPGLAVVNGRTYYVLNHEQTGAQGREITIHRNGDLHRWADDASAVTGSLKDGQTVTCGWWTRGTELPLVTVNYDGEAVTVGEPIWYIVGNDLDAGNRFWSGLSTERPD